MDPAHLPSPLAGCKPSAESIKTFKLSIHDSDDSTSGESFRCASIPSYCQWRHPSGDSTALNVLASCCGFNYRHLFKPFVDSHVRHSSSTVPVALINPLPTSRSRSMRCVLDQLEATPLLEGAVSGYVSVDQPMQSSSHLVVTPRKGVGSLIFPH